MVRKTERRNGGESTVADPTGHRWQNGLRGGFYKSTEKPLRMAVTKENIRQRSSSPDSIPGMVGGFHVYHDPSPVRREPDRSGTKKHATALHDIQNSLSELKRAAASKSRPNASYFTNELHKLRSKENNQHKQMKELKQAIRALNTTEPQHNDHKHSRDTDRGRWSYPQQEYADSPASGAESEQDGRMAELQRLSDEIGTLLQLADNVPPPRKSHSKKRSRSGHTPRTTHIDLSALTSRNNNVNRDHHQIPKVHQHPPQEYIYPTPSRRGRQRDKRRQHHQPSHRHIDEESPRTPDPPATRKPSTSPEWLKRARPSARPGSAVPEPQVTPSNTIRQNQQVTPAHIQPPVMRQQQQQQQKQQPDQGGNHVGVQPPGSWSQTPQQYGGPATSVGVGSSPARYASWPPRQATPPRHRHMSTSPGPVPADPVSQQIVPCHQSNVMGGNTSQQTSPQSHSQPQQQQQQTPVQRNWASQIQQNQPQKVRTPPGNWGQQQQQQQPQQQPTPGPWWDVQQQQHAVTPVQNQGGWAQQGQPPQHAQAQQQQQRSPNPWSGEPHQTQQQQQHQPHPHWVGAGTPVHERLPPPPWEQPATPEPAMWNDANALRGKVSHLEHALQRKAQEQETTEQSLLKEIQSLKEELGKVQEQQHYASNHDNNQIGYLPAQTLAAPQYAPMQPHQQQQCF